MARIIGIDLGTTNSAVAIMEGKQPKILENEQGQRTTPSVVAYSDEGTIDKVGEPAKRQLVTEPKKTCAATKRLIGRQVTEEEVKAYAKSVAYPIVAGENNQAVIQIGNKKIRPDQIASTILSEMKKIANRYLGHSVNQAVVTVPAYFNDQQRQATKDAGKIVDLEIVRIINEPTAAALAYGLDKELKKDAKIAVYDLGGGTFDISIIEIAEVDGDRQFEVLSTSGNTTLGGEDFDNAIINYLITDFKAKENIDLTKDPLVRQRLKEASEKAKIELTSTLQTEINIPFIASGESGPKHLKTSLTRAKLESLVQNFIEKTIESCKVAMKDAKLQANQIDAVILVGGQTRMPKVQETVENFFGKKPRQDINPDEAVAMGAAIQGAVLSGEVKDVLLLDVTPLSLGIETQGGVMTKLIEKNTTVPTKTQQVFSTAENNQTAVTIHIVQGERPMASANKSLGRFELSGILPAPRGVPQIEVSFELDANSILQVSAKDKATGKAQSIKITGGSGLTPEEIERMRQEAEEYKEKDQEFVELTQIKNTADSILDATLKAMENAGDKITNEEKEKLEAATKDLKEVLEGKDKAAIEAKLKALTDLSGQMSERLYAASDTNKANNENANEQQSENVADAEFEEIKDKSEK